jgi:hypothetical protein
MKVLDLQCADAHTFEGWFASEADYLDQQAKSMLACPLCGNTHIHKKLSAPRLNLGASAQAHSGADTPSAPGDMAPVPASASHGLSAEQMQVAYTHVVRELMRQTEDVGSRFAQEARAIHEGQAPQRGIRGQATPAQAQALTEDGIAVMTLPIPEFAKQTLQ